MNFSDLIMVQFAEKCTDFIFGTIIKANEVDELKTITPIMEAAQNKHKKQAGGNNQPAFPKDDNELKTITPVMEAAQNEPKNQAGGNNQPAFPKDDNEFKTITPIMEVPQIKPKKQADDNNQPAFTKDNNEFKTITPIMEASQNKLKKQAEDNNQPAFPKFDNEFKTITPIMEVPQNKPKKQAEDNNQPAFPKFDNEKSSPLLYKDLIVIPENESKNLDISMPANDDYNDFNKANERKLSLKSGDNINTSSLNANKESEAGINEINNIVNTMTDNSQENKEAAQAQIFTSGIILPKIMKTGSIKIFDNIENKIPQMNEEFAFNANSAFNTIVEQKRQSGVVFMQSESAERVNTVNTVKSKPSFNFNNTKIRPKYKIVKFKSKREKSDISI